MRTHTKEEEPPEKRASAAGKGGRRFGRSRGPSGFTGRRASSADAALGEAAGPRKPPPEPPPARRRRLRAASAVAAARAGGGGGGRRGEAARALPVRPPARPVSARGPPPMRRRCRRGHAAGAAAVRVLQRREQSEMAGTVGLGPAEGQCWCPCGRGAPREVPGPRREAGGRGARAAAPRTLLRGATRPPRARGPQAQHFLSGRRWGRVIACCVQKDVFSSSCLAPEGRFCYDHKTGFHVAVISSGDFRC